MQAVFSHRKRVVMALDESQTWHVAYTKPRQERIALENLERQDFEAYLPMFKVFKKPRRGAASPQGQGMLAYEPMFPRYIFFRATRPEQSLGTLRSTRGVASVVRFGIEFADVSCELLQARSEEHTSELQSLMRISYAVFCLKKKKITKITSNTT